MKIRFLIFSVICVLVFANMALALQPRYVPPKPETTIINEYVQADVIHVKFVEGSDVRLRNGELVSLNRTDIGDVQQFFAEYSTVDINRLFDLASEAKLTQDKINGEARTGQELADLNLWFVCHLPDDVNPQTFVDGLNAFDVVEIAYPAPIAEIPTPDFSGQQGYLYEAPSGVNAEYAWDYPGGQGENIHWIDIEGGWVWTHEDLPDPFFEGGEQDPDPGWWNHGTAVVGEVSGIHNDYGISGIAPQAEVGCVSIYTMSTATAIYMAYDNLNEGDFFLIELHAICPLTGNYICMEYWQANFDAIQTATSNGVHCTQAAGNGYTDMDDPVFNGLFDREVRDSGAIMCGAGHPTTLQRLNFSNYGSRLDSFGWGINVVTAGYGDLQGGDVDEWYTDGFSGTSSASPIVTGAAISLQGISVAMGGNPLPPLTLRSMLTATGSPQPDPSEYIGTRPNLVVAIDSLITTLSSFEGVVTDIDSGEPLAECRVFIEDTAYEAVTDANGFYHLSAAPGTYYLSAERFGYYYFISEETYTIESQDTVVVDIPLEIRPQGTLTGTVTNAQGLAIPEAILIPRNVPVEPFYTDLDGHYEIELAGDYQYTIDVLAGDYDPYDFTILVPAGEITTYDFELAFVQSFENSDGGFILSEGRNEWEHGMPVESGGPAQAYWGDNVWGTDLDGVYEPLSRYSIMSPSFAMEISEDPLMVIHMWYETREPWDGGNVTISTNNGETWELLHPTGGYPVASVVALSGQPGFSGESEGWQRVEFPLDGFTEETIQFRFRFSSTNESDFGWFLDNFSLYGARDFYVGVEDDLTTNKVAVPRTCTLHQNYPNPFNPETTIAFDLPDVAVVSLDIYDVTGQLIKSLTTNEELAAGYHTYIWDGSDDNGNALSSGLYFYRLETNTTTQTKQMLLLK